MSKFLFIIFLPICSILPCKAQLKTDKALPELLLDLEKSKPDTGRISLFLEVAMSYVLRAGSLQSDMDSARLFVSNALQLNNSIHSIEWEGKCFFVYSNIFREENNNEKGKQYAQKAIEDLSRSGKKIDLANSYVELARYYDPYNENEVKEKIKLNEQASQLFGEAGNKEEEANTIKHLGDLQLVNGDFKKALTELQEALNIFKEIHYPELQGVYDLMSTVSIQLGNYAEALKYGLLAMKTAESLKDSSAQLSTIYNHLGQTMYYLNNPGQSAQYYQKALSIVFKNKDTGSVFVIVHNLANAYVRADKPSEAIDILKSTEKNYVLPDLLSQVFIYSSFVYSYTAMKQYEFANHYVKKLLDISTKHDVTDGLQGDIYPSIIKYYLAIKQYKEVVKYCAFNEAFCKKYGVVKNLIANYRTWYRADSALGNFDAALSHYQMLTAINDSSFNEAKIKQISELQIQYETEKKDKDIQLLSKQGLLQKNQLRQAAILRNATLAGVAFLIIIVALLYMGYRMKQKTNSKLELQQKEINQKNISLQHLVNEKDWLVKEIHHRVKNNFHMVMGLLGTQSGYLKNEEAKSAIAESQQRIHAMSLIHQKLYQSDNLSDINMHDYIHELVDYLRDSFNITNNIRVNLQIDRISLDLSHCIPLGLMLNEAITNSFKYAFPNKQEGIIDISFKRTSGNHLLLTINDNGIGLPSGFNFNKPDSMGMNLIQGLSKDIDAEFTINSQNGTQISITFVYNPDVTMSITPIKTEPTNSI